MQLYLSFTSIKTSLEETTEYNIFIKELLDFT